MPYSPTNIFLITIFNFDIPVSSHKQHILPACSVDFKLVFTIKLVNLFFFCISDWSINSHNHHIKGYPWCLINVIWSITALYWCTIFAASFLTLKAMLFVPSLFFASRVVNFDCLIKSVTVQSLSTHKCLSFAVFSCPMFRLLHLPIIILSLQVQILYTSNWISRI